ncbi:MAG: hypothetical protein KUG73_05480 [Pseudomonadales bacterium]|nr:hypothetical protein [Pseudomonadales bacterium]
MSYISIRSVASVCFGCAVTPQEYKLQWYEGGSTIYGPNTAPFLAQHSKALFGEIVDSNSVSDLPNEWEFKFPRKRVGPVKFVDAVINQEVYRIFQFYGEPLGNIEWHESLIEIEFTTDDDGEWNALRINNRPVNNLGYDISITQDDDVDESGRQLYGVRWHNPEINPARKYRFVISPRKDQDVLYSAVFN